jgi:hypothetical protein
VVCEEDGGMNAVMTTMTRQSPIRVHGAALVCIFGIVSEDVPILEQKNLSVLQRLLLLEAECKREEDMRGQ